MLVTRRKRDLESRRSRDSRSRRRTPWRPPNPRTQPAALTADIDGRFARRRSPRSGTMRCMRARWQEDEIAEASGRAGDFFLNASAREQPIKRAKPREATPTLRIKKPLRSPRQIQRIAPSCVHSFEGESDPGFLRAHEPIEDGIPLFAKHREG